MLKKLAIVLGVLLLLLLACGGWFFFIRDTDPVANKLATSTPAPDSIIYGLDPVESSLVFLMPDAPLVGDINGTFDLIGGSLVMQPRADGEGFDLVVNMIIAGETVDTGSIIANQVMVAALQAEKYPCGVFTGVGDTVFTDASELVELNVKGNLEISGTTQDEKDFDTVFQVNDDGTSTMETNFTLSMADFGVDLGGEDLQATINIVARDSIDPNAQDLSLCAVEAELDAGDATPDGADTGDSADDTTTDDSDDVTDGETNE